MIFTLVLRPLALTDLQAAYDYYNSISENLGEEFLKELQNFLDKIQGNPFIHSYVKEPIRQGKIKRFPYHVIYEVKEQNILIYSIFMTEQNPDKKRTS